MPAEWLSAYNIAVAERDPERLEFLAAKARVLLLDHIEKMETEVLYLRDALHTLDAYVEAVRKMHKN